VRGIQNATRQGYTSDMVVDSVVNTMRRLRTKIAHGDQAEAFSLPSAFSQRGIKYIPHHWTAAKKEAAVSRVRRWFADGIICIEPAERMKAECLNFEERISGSGISFQGRARSRDDYVSLLLMTALVEMEDGEKMPSGQRMPGLPGSPVFAARNEAKRIREKHRLWNIANVLGEGKTDPSQTGYFDWTDGSIHGSAKELVWKRTQEKVDKDPENSERIQRHAMSDEEAAAWVHATQWSSEEK
jgi:hypothetical protein